MKDGFLKAAAAAPKIRVADPAWNALEICKALDSCYAQRAKLIVLPELCLTGYTCQDLFLQERLLEESLEGLQTVLEHTKGHDALTFVGLPFEKDGKLTHIAKKTVNLDKTGGNSAQFDAAIPDGCEFDTANVYLWNLAPRTVISPFASYTK